MTYKRNVEIEGRVQILLDDAGLARHDIINRLWNQTLQELRDRMIGTRYISGEDVYLTRPKGQREQSQGELRKNVTPYYRVRDLMVRYNGSETYYRALESKDSIGEEGKGKYGIRAINENVFTRNLSDSEMKRLKRAWELMGIVRGSRREVEVRYDGMPISLTVDDMCVPNFVGMEYELTLNGESENEDLDVKEGIKILEEFVDDHVVGILEKAESSHGIRYSWQEKTYPEIVIPSIRI